MDTLLAINIAGFLATSTSVIRLFPQGVRTFKQRNQPEAVEGLSLPTQWLTFINSAFWIIYGVLLVTSSENSWNAFWVAAPSVINVLVSIFIIYLIYRSRKQHK